MSNGDRKNNMTYSSMCSSGYNPLRKVDWKNIADEMEQVVLLLDVIMCEYYNRQKIEIIWIIYTLRVMILNSKK